MKERKFQLIARRFNRASKEGRAADAGDLYAALVDGCTDEQWARIESGEWMWDLQQKPKRGKR